MSVENTCSRSETQLALKQIVPSNSRVTSTRPIDAVKVASISTRVALSEIASGLVWCLVWPGLVWCLVSGLVWSRLSILESHDDIQFGAHDDIQFDS